MKKWKKSATEEYQDMLECMHAQLHAITEHFNIKPNSEK